MKEKYRTLLEKAYELEGLILLAMSKDEMPEGLQELIERKVSELMEEENAKRSAEEQSQKLEIPEDDSLETKVSAEEDSAHDSSLEEDITYQVPAEEDDMPYYSLVDEEEERPSRRKPRLKEQKKLPVFSLNDRFLFIRELFEGDAAVFNEALNRIAACRNFDDAKEYLTKERGLNPDEREEDERFLGIIEAYFRK